MKKNILKNIKKFLQKLHLTLNENTIEIFAQNVENYLQNHPEASIDNIIINSLKQYILKNPHPFIDPYQEIYKKANEIFNDEDNSKNFQTFVIITFHVLIQSSIIEKENDIYAVYSSIIRKGKPNLSKIDMKDTPKKQTIEKTGKNYKKECIHDGLFVKIRSDEDFKDYSDKTLNEYLQMYKIKSPKSFEILKLRHNEDFLGWNDLDKKNVNLYNSSLRNFKIFMKSENAFQKPHTFFTKMRSYKECEHLTDEELLEYLEEFKIKYKICYKHIIERHSKSLEEWNPLDHQTTQYYCHTIRKLLELIKTKEHQKLMIRLLNILKYAKDKKEMSLAKKLDNHFWHTSQ